MLHIKNIIAGLLFLISVICLSQEQTDSSKAKNPFWENVHYGGGLQLSIGNGYTAIGVSPSAVYEFSDKLASGLGLSYLYTKNKYSDLQYNVYGSSIVALYNPIKEIQLSTEFEEMYVSINSDQKNSYWLPAWYMGVAYSMGRRAAIGVRYDVLYNDKSIYDSEFTPFIRVYF